MTMASGRWWNVSLISRNLPFPTTTSRYRKPLPIPFPSEYFYYVFLLCLPRAESPSFWVPEETTSCGATRIGNLVTSPFSKRNHLRLNISNDIRELSYSWSSLALWDGKVGNPSCESYHSEIGKSIIGNVWKSYSWGKVARYIFVSFQKRILIWFLWEAVNDASKTASEGSQRILSFYGL